MSHYWRDYQTWRKYDGPEPEADAEVVEVVVVSSEHDEADDDDKARDAVRENETDDKKTSEAGSDVQIIWSYPAESVRVRRMISRSLILFIYYVYTDWPNQFIQILAYIGAKITKVKINPTLITP